MTAEQFAQQAAARANGISFDTHQSPPVSDDDAATVAAAMGTGVEYVREVLRQIPLAQRPEFLERWRPTRAQDQTSDANAQDDSGQDQKTADIASAAVAPVCDAVKSAIAVRQFWDSILIELITMR